MIRYFGAFAFSASIPFLWMWSPQAPLLVFPAILLILIGAEVFAPKDNSPRTKWIPDIAFRLLPIIYIPCQLALICWGVVASASATASVMAALALSIGLTTGIFGMLTAHEMIHSKKRTERFWGALMLTGMSYRHFQIAHIHGHHRWAATERDPATARMSEGFYRFFLRTIAGQFIQAWQFENLRNRDKSFAAFRNRVLHDVVMLAALLVAMAIFFNGRSVVFFLIQSVAAILVLEMFNYVAHYGLIRTSKPGGGFESFGHQHSWNSGNRLSNPIIFNMGRHSDHHTHPSSPYQSLLLIAGAPELPLGYAGAILLAIVPPLWRRVMDPKVHSLRARNSPAI